MKINHILFASLLSAAFILNGFDILAAQTEKSKNTPAAKTNPSAANPAPDADPVIARVNGFEIHKSDAALAAADLGVTTPSALDDPQRLFQVATYLVDLNLLSMEASRRKVEYLPIVIKELEYNHEKILAKYLLLAGITGAIGADEVQKYYDEKIKNGKPVEEINARHILVTTEDDAKAIADALKKGADFATLARQRSIDPTKADGGNLGFFAKDQLLPEFTEAAFALKDGETSAPVHSKLGWHIIKVEAHRTRPTPTLEQAQGQIRLAIAQQKQNDIVERLKKESKIEILVADPNTSTETKPAETKPATSANGKADGKESSEKKK